MHGLKTSNTACTSDTQPSTMPAPETQKSLQTQWRQGPRPYSPGTPAPHGTKTHYVCATYLRTNSCTHTHTHTHRCPSTCFRDICALIHALTHTHPTRRRSPSWQYRHGPPTAVRGTHQVDAAPLGTRGRCAFGVCGQSGARKRRAQRRGGDELAGQVQPLTQLRDGRVGRRQLHCQRRDASLDV